MNTRPLSLLFSLALAVWSTAGCSDTSAPKSAAKSEPATVTPSADKQDEAIVQKSASGDEQPATASKAQDSPPAKGATGIPEGDFTKTVYGNYFVGWPKPKLALVISGRQDGYFEPCGCAGLENQKGGFSRRHTLFQMLAARGWPLAAIDVGGLVHRFGKQAEVKFSISAEALQKLGYNAVGFGANDLRLSAGEIVAAVAGAKPEDSIFVSANVALFGLTPKVRVFEAGGLKLGLTSVLGDELQKQVNNAEVQIGPAGEAIEKVLPELKQCDVRILLANATLEESSELAKRFPEFEFIVSGEGSDEPPREPKLIEGTKSRLIEVGHKGMFVIVVGFFDDPKQPLRFQRVALDARFKDSDDMKQLMAAYQDQLQQLGWEGLGIKAVPHPRANKNAKQPFAGAASCKTCHESEWEVWSQSKHAHATETLAKADPPRQFDPECISCHATGWNPQEFFPYRGGFDSLEKTPLLTGNSCENCHGPGAAHNVAEKAGNTPHRDAERAAMKVTLQAAKTEMCVKCHDVDNSPEFQKEGAFEKYWAEIEH